MRRLNLILMVCFAAMALASTALAQQISGEYIESRNADVYTGHCYAMSEINLVGDQAIMAWRVSKGEWNGVRLDGLSVVGVAKAASTLGNPYLESNPAKAVLILDEKATPEQREALKSMAKAMSNGLLDDLVGVEVAPISIEVEYDGEHPSSGTVQAGEIASVVTRSITAKDHLCGNEQVYYPPLSATAHSMPAVASLDQFNGKGLGANWTLHDKRSAFVGHFAR